MNAFDPHLSFEVVTSAGQPIKTFDDRKAAVDYAASVAEVFPGLAVERVLRRPDERLRIWTERKLRLVERAA